jgi:hypothetical protein
VVLWCPAEGGKTPSEDLMQPGERGDGVRQAYALRHVRVDNPIKST